MAGGLACLAPGEGSGVCAARTAAPWAGGRSIGLAIPVLSVVFRFEFDGLAVRSDVRPVRDPIRSDGRSLANRRRDERGESASGRPSKSRSRWAESRGRVQMRASQAEDADLARTENLFRIIRRAADKRKSERRAAAAIGRVQRLDSPGLYNCRQYNRYVDRLDPGRRNSPMTTVVRLRTPR